MGMFSNFLNRRSLNAIHSMNESKEYVQLMLQDLKTDPVLTTNNWSTRYKEMVKTLDSEQFDRFKIFTIWARLAWLIVLFMLLWSTVNLNYFSMLYYSLFTLCLYLFIGYRFWVFNTKLYPPFRVYLRMFYKYPLASIPFNTINTKDL